MYGGKTKIVFRTKSSFTLYKIGQFLTLNIPLDQKSNEQPGAFNSGAGCQ
jgi:hypothetical protein